MSLTLLPSMSSLLSPLLAAVLLTSTAAMAAPAGAGPAAKAGQEAACGGFPRADNGPHDYRTVRDKRLSIVEQYHFTPSVEMLIKGSSSQDLAGDISFMLRAFPNHHRALMSIVRLGERTRSEQPRGSAFTVDCWLERATRFAPDDAVARMIYAGYLNKRGRAQDALVQMDRVAAVAGDSAFTHYNAGLILIEMKQYERALAHAHKAYALGFSRLDLREKLQSAGQWKDPPDAAATAPAPAASAAAAASAASPASAP
ncbi:hypothetical protein HLB44_05925 [Aquincola sp. S2]|uniref:ABC transporter permease n=1 Tax=Pseudaquabacterium terrae TaxID=2732868 RepID=A0ABX2EBL8_9BURK|nr:hypothetical protein [Aquabacterium terrae]